MLWRLGSGSLIQEYLLSFCGVCCWAGWVIWTEKRNLIKFHTEHMRSNNISKSVFSVFLGAVTLLALLVLSRYPGHGYVYVGFTIIANLLFCFGFRKNAIFFDTFIGIFFWLGFWLKLTIRIAFFDGFFNEPVGYFDGSGDAFDKALLVSSCGMLGLLVASFLREKLSCNYPLKIILPLLN